MIVVKAKKIKKRQVGRLTTDDEEWPATSFGKYSSRIALSENIEFEKIKAEVKDGVLYITIPKASTISNIIEIDVQ
ncbi:Small heat shock protein [Tripterygium wilfordii]|uniref:Small heat shock protein n=1 Tax=Tripterygium wilfordii TaxID=458696 RepID=A0A7J7D2Z7_TRIWF|nr:Small heat shock protein [Tripterygium wilfordii]